MKEGGEERLGEEGVGEEVGLPSWRAKRRRLSPISVSGKGRSYQLIGDNYAKKMSEIIFLWLRKLE